MALDYVTYADISVKPKNIKKIIPATINIRNAIIT